MASFKWRHSSFQLDALMVVEINEIVNELVSLLESLDFWAVDTLCFEDREEILGHGIIIAISSS